MSDQDRSGGNSADTPDFSAADMAARLSRRRAARLSAATRDLFTASGPRLSDHHQAEIKAMIDGLVASVEDDLRARLLADPALPDNEGLRAALGAGHVPIAKAWLDRAGLPADPQLIAAALARADAHRLAKRLRRDSAAAGSVLDALIGDEDVEIAAAAMAVLIAESRSNARFDDPILHETDLPGDVRMRLIWRVAGALRHYGVEMHGVDPDALDRAVGAAGQAAIDASDEPGLSDAAAALARRLARRNGTDAAYLADAFEGGRVTLYAALLAAATAMDTDAIWEFVSDGDGTAHALALRAAGIDRERGAPLVLAALDDPVEQAGVPPWLSVWEAIDAQSAQAALEAWRLPSGYRAALVELAGSRPS